MTQALNLERIRTRWNKRSLLFRYHEAANEIAMLCDEVERLRALIHENVCDKTSSYVNLTLTPEELESCGPHKPLRRGKSTNDQ